MKQSLTFLFTLMLCSWGFSQSWETVSSNEQVSIYAKEVHHQRVADDIDHQIIIFKYENHTSSPVQITFNRDLNYGGHIYYGDNAFTVSIPANAVVQYDESKAHDNNFFIYKKDNKGYIKESLDNFKVTNLKTEKQ